MKQEILARHFGWSLATLAGLAILVAGSRMAWPGPPVWAGETGAPAVVEAPKDAPKRAQEPSAEDLKKLKLNAGFEEADLKKACQGSIEVADAKSIELVKDPVRSGKQAIKFTVSPGKLVNNGSRAEVAYQHGDKAGDERWYAWSVYIPKDFEDVPYKDPQTGENMWQVIGQFHDQPDTAKGETWDNFPGAGNSPPVQISYGLFKGDNLFSFIYGSPEMKSVALVKIEKGRWYDMALHIKWSRGADGFGELWVNGKNMTPTPIKGPNMHNDASHYFKVGLYRNRKIKTTNSIYIDAIRFGDTREAVMP